MIIFFQEKCFIKLWLQCVADMLLLSRNIEGGKVDFNFFFHFRNFLSLSSLATENHLIISSFYLLKPRPLPFSLILMEMVRFHAHIMWKCGLLILRAIK